MNQIFTIFFYLSRWHSSIIFQCHGAFWEDFREFQAENFNFKQATLFFLKNWVLMFKRVFRAKYALFCDFFWRKQLFLSNERLIFQKIELTFYYEEAFSRYWYAKIAYFLTFFQCFACNWPTRCEPIFSKFQSEV